MAYIRPCGAFSRSFLARIVPRRITGGMRACAALVCYLVVIVLAWRSSGSTSGFLLRGPAVVLLLDRFLGRLLAWPTPNRWARDLAGCAMVFLLGSAVFALLRPGLVPWWEAIYRGALACLTLFACESLLRLLPPTRRWSRWGLRGAMVGLFVLLIPVGVALHPLHTVPKRTPASLGLAFEDVRFRAADDVLLAGWLVPHPAGRGNVIFCHGHGRNRGHLAGLLPAVHALGLNVLTFDFRGHGDSEGHTSTFGHREVADLVAAAGYLRDRFPGKPLFLVGTSLGAAVSLQALPQLPDVAGVWSEGAFGRLDRVVDNEFACLPQWVRKPLVAFYHQLGRLDCGLCIGDVNPVESMRGVSVPVFFCHGEKDELVPLSEGESLYEACRGPRWCWWAAEASHYRVRQRHHDEYLRRLRSFLEERLVR
jgi:fermentation-respiration switch protein FrsA (DUF1100 family)